MSWDLVGFQHAREEGATIVYCTHIMDGLEGSLV